MDERRRKKWTPVEQPDDAVLKLREKRKWQIALRRYIIEKNKCVQYAPYFGVDIETFRLWIASQFINDFSWDDFSDKWQLDHVIPVAYFDFANEEDLRLCWHFLNIRVNFTHQEAHRPDLLTAKSYFETLYKASRLPICLEFIQKIDILTQSQVPETATIAGFLREKIAYLQRLEGFSSHDFQQLNEGVPIEEVLAEKTLLKNFG